MTEQNPPYPIVRVIILGVILPLLALCYLGYSINLFAHNPTDASFEANLHVLWTLIKAVVFSALGYFSFALAHGAY